MYLDCIWIGDIEIIPSLKSIHEIYLQIWYWLIVTKIMHVIKSIVLNFKS